MNTVVQTRELLEARGEPETLARVDSETSDWLTPGRVLAERIAHREEVRLVLERLGPNRNIVFVVLERDPEDILNLIYDAEHELYSRFQRLPFDVRVTTVGPTWSDEGFRSTAFVHYDRERFRGQQAH